VGHDEYPGSGSDGDDEVAFEQGDAAMALVFFALPPGHLVITDAS
jgi:hypothetical protein